MHPKPDIEIVEAASWRKEPKPIKGYAVIEDSVRNYVNKFTGMDGQFYRMIALNTTRSPERGEKLLPGTGAAEPQEPPPTKAKKPKQKPDKKSGTGTPPARTRKKNENRRN